MEATWFRYVPHAMVKAYELLGWTKLDGLVGTSHGHRSTLMEYKADIGEDDDVSPPMPSEVASCVSVPTRVETPTERQPHDEDEQDEDDHRQEDREARRSRHQDR